MKLEKVCPKCQMLLPAEMFGRRKNGTSLRSYCKPCANRISRTWAKSNPERRLENGRRWRAEKPELARALGAKWRRENPDRQREIARKTKEKNKDKARERRRIRSADPEVRRKLLAYQAKYRQAPNARLAHNLRSRLNDALKRRAKRGSAVALLGCSVDQAVAHIERQFKQGMSWDNYGQWELDHIVPLASFDLTDSEQLKRACHFTNIQPLWVAENRLKGRRIVQSQSIEVHRN